MVSIIDKLVKLKIRETNLKFSTSWKLHSPVCRSGLLALSAFIAVLLLCSIGQASERDFLGKAIGACAEFLVKNEKISDTEIWKTVTLKDQHTGDSASLGSSAKIERGAVIGTEYAILITTRVDLLSDVEIYRECGVKAIDPENPRVFGEKVHVETNSHVLTQISYEDVNDILSEVLSNTFWELAALNTGLTRSFRKCDSTAGGQVPLLTTFNLFLPRTTDWSVKAILVDQEVLPSCPG